MEHIKQNSIKYEDNITDSNKIMKLNCINTNSDNFDYLYNLGNSYSIGSSEYNSLKNDLVKIIKISKLNNKENIKKYDKIIKDLNNVKSFNKNLFKYDEVKEGSFNLNTPTFKREVVKLDDKMEVNLKHFKIDNNLNLNEVYIDYINNFLKKELNKILIQKIDKYSLINEFINIHLGGKKKIKSKSPRDFLESVTSIYHEHQSISLSMGKIFIYHNIDDKSVKYIKEIDKLDDSYRIQPIKSIYVPKNVVFILKATKTPLFTFNYKANIYELVDKALKPYNKLLTKFKITDRNPSVYSYITRMEL